MWEAERPLCVITHRPGLFFSPFSHTASSERMGTLEGEASSWLNIAKTGRVILVLLLYKLPHKASRSVQWLWQIAAPMQLLHFYTNYSHTHAHTHLCSICAPTPNRASFFSLSLRWLQPDIPVAPGTEVFPGRLCPERTSLGATR